LIHILLIWWFSLFLGDSAAGKMRNPLVLAQRKAGGCIPAERRGSMSTQGLKEPSWLVMKSARLCYSGTQPCRCSSGLARSACAGWHDCATWFLACHALVGWHGGPCYLIFGYMASCASVHNHALTQTTRLKLFFEWFWRWLAHYFSNNFWGHF